MYGMEDKQRDGVVQSELLCGGRQGWCRCEGEGAFDVQGRDEALHADRSAINRDCREMPNNYATN